MNKFIPGSYFIHIYAIVNMCIVLSKSLFIPYVVIVDVSVYFCDVPNFIVVVELWPVLASL